MSNKKGNTENKNSEYNNKVDTQTLNRHTAFTINIEV